LDGATCSWRFEAGQDREIDDFECGRELSVPTIGAQRRGTGEHATTAMSLRLLEQLTRCWKRGWSLADLGTGTGIIALAAKRFGAAKVLGIDINPTAISMAKSNARLNKIHGVTLQLGDVREWKPAHNTHIISANLYSDLLTEILPKLKHSDWLILSGILRSQQTEFVSALLRNKFEITGIKHRGKWITIFGGCGAAPRAPNRAGGKVLRRS
jgi:ribosomal protein L11 methyltransferase